MAKQNARCCLPIRINAEWQLSILVRQTVPDPRRLVAIANSSMQKPDAWRFGWNASTPATDMTAAWKRRGGADKAPQTKSTYMRCGSIIHGIACSSKFRTST